MDAVVLIFLVNISIIVRQSYFISNDQLVNDIVECTIILSVSFILCSHAYHNTNYESEQATLEVKL
jgi:hypothetical protein